MTTLQIILLIVMVLVAVSGLNLAFLLKLTYRMGKFAGIVEQRFKDGDKQFKKIDDSLNNHIPSSIGQIYDQLRAFSKVIGEMDRRLVRVETILNGKK